MTKTNVSSAHLRFLAASTAHLPIIVPSAKATTIPIKLVNAKFVDNLYHIASLAQPNLNAKSVNSITSSIAIKNVLNVLSRYLIASAAIRALVAKSVT